MENIQIINKDSLGEIKGGRRGLFRRLRFFLRKHPNAIARWRLANSDDEEGDHNRRRHFLAEHPHAIERYRAAHA